MDKPIPQGHLVRKNDVKAHGEYRSKRVILKICDERAETIRSGRPYQPRLHPPPATRGAAIRRGMV